MLSFFHRGWVSGRGYLGGLGLSILALDAATLFSPPVSGGEKATTIFT